MNVYCYYYACLAYDQLQMQTRGRGSKQKNQILLRTSLMYVPDVLVTQSWHIQKPIDFSPTEPGEIFFLLVQPYIC